MTFLEPDAGLNEKTISADFALRLATKVTPTQSKEQPPIEASLSVDRPRSADEIIQAIRERQQKLTRTEPLPQPENVVDTIPTERVRRSLADALPGQEFRDKGVQAVDPDGKLKLIVSLTMTRLREEIRNPSGIDPLTIVRSMAFDPGVDENDIRILNEYVVRLQQDPSLSAPPRHKQRDKRPTDTR